MKDKKKINWEAIMKSDVVLDVLLLTGIGVFGYGMYKTGYYIGQADVVVEIAKDCIKSSMDKAVEITI